MIKLGLFKTNGKPTVYLFNDDTHTSHREEIEALQERHGTSRDALIGELQEKEHELEDSMTIVSLLQEQIKSGHGSLRVAALLEEIKDKNTLIPKVASLEKG